MRSSPSFSGLKAASEHFSQSMRGNRKRDTKPEVILRRALWRLNLRFRKHVDWLPGTPDVVFTRVKISVFCDGDFWHGRKWDERKEKLAQGHNAQYWTKKIESNMKRDATQTAQLVEMGWHVIRLWESDVLRDPDGCAIMIKHAVMRRRDELYTRHV